MNGFARIARLSGTPLVALLAVLTLPNAGHAQTPIPIDPRLVIKPDLTVTAIEPVGQLRRGFCNTINVTVKNNGPGPVTSAPVQLTTCTPGWLEPEAGLIPYMRSLNQTLLGGQSGVLTFTSIGLTSSATSPACLTIGATADPNNGLAEGNEDNNSFSRTLPGPTGDCFTVSVTPTEFTEPSSLTFTGTTGGVSKTINVNLSGAASETITMNYRVYSRFSSVDGASCSDADADLVRKNGTLSFSPGQTTKPVTFTLCKDSRAEGDEQFSFQLDAVSGPVSYGNLPGREFLLKIHNTAPTRLR